MPIANLKRQRTRKPENNLQVSNWERLFSIPPARLFLHTADEAEVYDAVSGRTFSTDLNAGGVAYGPFGREFDTEDNAWITDALSSANGFSAFTFCRYNNNTSDHQLISFANQDPMIFADTSASALRPGMFAGTEVYGTAGSLDNDIPGYAGVEGYHCWGAAMGSSDATSGLYVNGVEDVTGNPNAFGAQTTLRVYENTTTSRQTDANVVWTILFEGKLPKEEAEYLTGNPEEIYRILEDRQLPLYVGVAPTTIIDTTTTALNITENAASINLELLPTTVALVITTYPVAVQAGDVTVDATLEQLFLTENAASIDYELLPTTVALVITEHTAADVFYGILLYANTTSLSLTVNNTAAIDLDLNPTPATITITTHQATPFNPDVGILATSVSLIQTVGRASIRTGLDVNVSGYVRSDVVCPVCGFIKPKSEFRLRWDGVQVCKDDWEPRHPQEFVRSVETPVSKLEGFIEEKSTIFIKEGGTSVSGETIAPIRSGGASTLIPPGTGFGNDEL